MGPVLTVGRLAAGHVGVTFHQGQGEPVQQSRVDQEVVPEPALGAARELAPVEGQIAGAEAFHERPVRPDRPRHPVEDVGLGGIDGRQTRCGRCGEDHRHVERAGTDQDRPAAAGTARDDDALRGARRLMDVLAPAARGAEDDGQPVRLPDPQSRPGARSSASIRSASSTARFAAIPGSAPSK